MSHAKGFTLIELLIAVLVSAILVTMTVSVYNLFRRAMAYDTDWANASQNGRVALDRLGRELRQSAEVVTTLPADQSDGSITQPHEIIFEDGHANDLTYRRYYLVGTTLKLDVLEFYFASDPSTRVKWDAIGGGGTNPVSSVISTQDVAEMVQSISFFGPNPIQVLIQTGNTDSGVTTVMQTSVTERN